MLQEKLEDYEIAMMQDGHDEVIIPSEKFHIVAAIRNKTQPKVLIEHIKLLRAGEMIDGDDINFKGMMFRRI